MHQIPQKPKGAPASLKPTKGIGIHDKKTIAGRVAHQSVEGGEKLVLVINVATLPRDAPGGAGRVSGRQNKRTHTVSGGF